MSSLAAPRLVGRRSPAARCKDLLTALNRLAGVNVVIVHPQAATHPPAASVSVHPLVP